MKRIKLYEDFLNNQEGSLITIDEIIDCIKNDGSVYARIIKDFPGNDPDKPLKPLSIDEFGLVTVDFEGKEYEIPIKYITRVE
jgi:hypothetical protein